LLRQRLAPDENLGLREEAYKASRHNDLANTGKGFVG
jgi:hypothetical protein